MILFVRAKHWATLHHWNIYNNIGKTIERRKCHQLSERVHLVVKGMGLRYNLRSLRIYWFLNETGYAFFALNIVRHHS